MKKYNLFTIVVLILVVSCNSATKNSEKTAAKSDVVEENALTAPEKNDGWQLLFDNELSNVIDEKGVWYYEGDVLTSSEDACIFTKVEYENFIIDLEFKNEKGTNSGVIVYCTDRQNWIPNTVEIQIGDDYYFKDKDWFPNWMCGGVFGHLAPSSTLVKKAGE